MLGGEQVPPPVYFNHTTIYVSPEIYAALAQSPFLQNEFSRFNEQTIQRDGGTWSYTGIYLSGQHTYLEFMKAGPQVRPSGTTTVTPGSLEFGMWIDDRNQLPIIRDSLAAEAHKPLSIVTTKAFRNGQDIRWFDTTAARLPDDRSLPIRTWVMSVYPDFLRKSDPDLKPEDDGTTREKLVGRRYVPERLLHDITAFTITVNDAERDQLMMEFRAYGYAIHADGEKVIADGPEIQFVLLTGRPDARRTLTVDISLNRAKSGEQSYRFGDASELRFHDDRTASWTFTFVGNEAGK